MKRHNVPDKAFILVFSHLIVVFSIEHISVQSMLRMSTHMMVCVCHLKTKYPFEVTSQCFESKVAFCRRYKGFYILCELFWDLCLEFRENEACFQKMCVSNREKLYYFSCSFSSYSSSSRSEEHTSEL